MDLRAFRAVAVAALGAAVACVPQPALQFFTPLPAGQSAIGPVVDTVLVVRYGRPDSVSADGVHLAYDLLDRARAANQDGVIEIIEDVLGAVPSADRVRQREPGTQEADVLRRAQGRTQAAQMDMMRADVVTIQQVAADTVEADGAWLALILTGVATLDATAGVRTP